MRAVFYTEHDGKPCARIRLMLNRNWLFVFLDERSQNLVDICLPGDLLSVKNKLTQDEVNVAAARARKTLVAHEQAA
jgi:hypothetical protein